MLADGFRAERGESHNPRATLVLRTQAQRSEGEHAAHAQRYLSSTPAQRPSPLSQRISVPHVPASDLSALLLALACVPGGWLGRSLGALACRSEPGRLTRLERSSPPEPSHVKMRHGWPKRVTARMRPPDELPSHRAPRYTQHTSTRAHAGIATHDMHSRPAHSTGVVYRPIPSDGVRVTKRGGGVPMAWP